MGLSANPRTIIAQSPMSRLQLAAVTMCILLTALAGYDVLAISFAAPGIASEWGIDRAALGVVLSMELIGMSVGPMVLGNLADRIGRRPNILICLVMMTIGMLLSVSARNVAELSAWRFLTGLGIGGVMASTGAIAAEFSSIRRKNLSVILMSGGYPFGVIVGGSVASWLLAAFEWRSVFVLGGVATAAFIPLTWLLLPESIEYLLRRRPENALRRINDTLRRMGHAALDAMPAAPPGAVRPGLRALFTGGMARTTLVLTVAYLAHIMTFYFIIKWIPKIVVDMGYSPALAGGVLVWANVGGVSGSVLIGLLSLRYTVKALVLAALLAGAVLVALFGQGQGDLAGLSAVAGAAGFFTNAAVAGLYALFAQSFPTELRAGGTGFVIGIGHGGSVLGPIVAGLLFAAGAGLPTVAGLMACGSLVAAGALLALKTAAR